MESIIEKLYSQLRQLGYQGRVVSIQRLHDLQREIEGRYAQGLFDEDFYRERLAWYSFKIPDDLFKVASFIVVAVPRPQTKAGFTWNGETRSLIIPPTYVSYAEIPQQVGDLLAGWLTAEGYHVALAKMPLKPLAVRSGLGSYGRNNICYVPGMGSFLQLMAFYSDLPCEGDDWREPRMMDRCQTCQACLHQCPTGAIASDRFLLHAERCIVFHNERPPDHPFPTWLDPAWHNCVVGCMRCQEFCPEDRQFLKWIEGDDAFSLEETSLLLAGASPDRLLAATIEKLQRLELIDSLDVLPRNLGVFFNRTHGSR